MIPHISSPSTNLGKAEAWGRSTVATIDNRADTNNTSVNGARNAVVKLDVKLRNGVFYTRKVLVTMQAVELSSTHFGLPS